MHMRRSRAELLNEGDAQAWLERIDEAHDELRAFLGRIIDQPRWGDFYGDDPHAKNQADPLPDYKPQFIAILYLRLQADWTVDVNHACYSLTAAETAQESLRLEKALQLLEYKVANNNVDFGMPGAPYAPVPHHVPLIAGMNHDAVRPSDSGILADFKFKSQNETFIFLHHPLIDVTLYGNRLLGFKAQGPASKLPDKLPNDTFYNARAVRGAQTRTLDLLGSLIRVENHATGVATDGGPFPYAMEIKFQIKGGGGLITMVVDPDTGNGAGYEP